MSINVYIDSFGGNVIGALADGNKLIEYHIEKSNAKQVVGSIYKGRVQNVLNGMQAAFVDVGLDKNGYLFVGDTLVDKDTMETVGGIESCLNISEGEEIMVQAVKDPSGTKGVRLTKHVSLAGKYVVYVPTINSNTVSRKILDETSKQKLEKILNSIKCKKGGFIARTASENANPREIKKEALTLIEQYEEILNNYKTAKVGDTIYNDGDLVMRLMRDLLTIDLKNIIVADKNIYERLLKMSKSREKLRKKLVFYNEKEDLFKRYNLTSEIESLLHNRVALESGAYLIIDRTEALTVIDVNTGSFVGNEHLEDTVFNTNLLAAKEIARQVRLRNIGGIVIVDFIDMQSPEHREQLVLELTNALKEDRFKCNVIGMTGLGIVEFTRRKKRKEVSSFLNRACPYCKGEGKILSNDYVVMKIRTSLLDLFSEGYSSAIINLNVEVCNYILSEGTLYKDVKKFWNDKRIYLVPHKTYHHEYFQVKGENDKVLTVPDNAILIY